MNFDSLLSFFKCYIYTSLLFKSFKFCGLCYLLSAYILVFQEVCILGFSQGSWLCDGVSDLLWKLDHVQFFFFFGGKESLLYFQCWQPGWEWRGWTPVQRHTHPHWQSVGKSFYRQREGATFRISTVSSDSHLFIFFIFF